MNIIEVFEREFMDDDEPVEKKADQLERLYDSVAPDQRMAIDDTLIALCGWSMASLRSKARE